MKTILTRKPAVMCAFALTTLSACGGGGGGAADVPLVQDVTAFKDAASIEASDLVVHSLIGGNEGVGQVTRVSGTLNREGNTLSFGDISGTLSADRTSVALSDGTITLDGDDDAAAVRFRIESASSNALGIIGVAANPAALPAGDASYTGDAVLTAISGTDVYDLTGVASVTADFGAATPTVTTVLSGLEGTLQTISGSTAIADAGTLTIAGSGVTDANITGGTATLDSTVLMLADNPETVLEGGFYGENGGEVGGVFTVGDGTTTLQGDFLAN